MAISDQNPNQLREVAQALRRRLWQVLLPGAVFLSLAYALATLMPKTYTAQTSLELRESTIPINGQGFDATAIQRDVSNTPWQIKQFERVRRVLEKLEWPEFTTLTPLEQAEFVRDTVLDITVTTPGVNLNKLQGSTQIVIAYKNVDPQRAEQFVNRLRDAYTSEVLDRYRNDAKKALDVLRNQMGLASDEARLKDESAAKLKREAGVSATQQAPGGGRQRDEDPIYTRLTKSESELYDTASQIALLKEGVKATRKQFEDEPAEVPDLRTASGLTFDEEIAKIEEEILAYQEQQVGLKPKHSTYLLAESKIEKLIDRKIQLNERATAPSSQLTLKPNEKRERLQAQIEQKEIDIKELEGKSAQLEADVKDLRTKHAGRVEVFRQIQQLDREAQIAADAYAKAAADFARQKRFVDLINEGYSNPFEVTELARAPQKPTSPSDLIVIAAGTILGLGIGLLWAVIGEFGRNGYRGVSDAARGLGVPVLGVVNRITTRAQRQTVRVRRAILGASTALMIAGVFWMTWAYRHQPQVLGKDLVTAIGNLEKALR